MPKFNPDKLTKVTVEVTDRLIKKGDPNDSQSCPVALALIGVVGKTVEVDASYEQITFELPGDNLDTDDFVIDTPARVQKFMEKMDARDPNDIAVEYDNDGEPLPIKLPPAPKPISFVVRIPNRFLRPKFKA